MERRTLIWSSRALLLLSGMVLIVGWYILVRRQSDLMEAVTIAQLKADSTREIIAGRYRSLPVGDIARSSQVDSLIREVRAATRNR